MRLFRILRAALSLRCPRCGVGKLYAKPFRMFEHCPHCQLKFEREQGYFVVATYINYAATVAIALPGFFLLDALTTKTIQQQLAVWVTFAVVFDLLFFLHARSLRLALAHVFT